MTNTRLFLRMSALSLLMTISSAQVPNLGSAVLLPGDATIGTAAGDQRDIQIAHGANGYLAVWTDTRSKLQGQQSDDDVWCARMDASGTAIAWNALAVLPGYQVRPQVAWNGSMWLVVFESQDPTSGYFGTALRGVRVAADGTPVDLVPFTVHSPYDGFSALWSLTANGSEWVVASEGTSAGQNDLVGTRINANGQVVQTAVLQPADFFLHFGIHLTAAGGELLLCYNGNSSVVARRFSSTLAPIGAPFTPPSNRIGSNGSSYYVVWNNGFGLLGSPMTTQGTLAIPAGAVIDSTHLISAWTSASWDGSRWWVAMQSGLGQMRLARIDAAGAVLDQQGISLAPSAPSNISTVSVVGTPGGGAQVAWSSTSTLNGVYGADTFGVHVDSTLNFAPEQALGRSAPSQIAPAIARGPDGFLVVFESIVGPVRRVRAQRIRLDGTALDAIPIELGSGSVFGATPAAAWNGSVFVATWNDGSNMVVARRLAGDGTLLDAAPITLMAGASMDVASVGDTFVVVTTTYITNPQQRGVVFRRLSGSTGQLLDSGATLVPLSIGFAQEARCETFGNRVMAVWQSHFSHDDAQASLAYAFIGVDGVATTPFGLGIPGGSADVAVGTNGALVVWRLFSLAAANNDIVCRTVAFDGTLGPQRTVSNAPARQLVPRATWDGTQFLVAFEDQRNQFAFYDTTTEIHGSRVDVNGVVLDPNGFAWSTPNMPCAWPALATNGARTMLVTSVLHPEAGLGSFRVECVPTLGNPAQPARFCDALPNSTGLAAHIGSSGSSAFSSNDLVLTCSNLPANALGLFFVGTSAMEPALPFGDGRRCVGGVLRRLPLVLSSLGSVAQTQNLNDGFWSGVVPGDTRYVQFWHRDAAAGASGFNASDALELTIGS